MAKAAYLTHLDASELTSGGLGFELSDLGFSAAASRAGQRLARCGLDR